ncbi:hypothetical protein [Phytohabitans aurantiacus]|uniref:Uncharacterized protein n=1 Tax=Phytohabitans aurantiacus TaxID=3016789 RepID=A0ABQ5R3Q6_9ACTN|nr:hypothetical protein [Phytohabitans aurantiacus]GLI00590.1 hypothetical protein Pa4123_58660 [Phytohabitans aurantiacus]
MTGQLTISTLTLQHKIPPGGDWGAAPDSWAEVRPLIDGVDVLKEVHPEGFAPSCRHWTGPAETWPLAVTEEPRRVMITEPDCHPGCCGALYVTMRREGDQVIWEDWKNTSNVTKIPADVRFDLSQYEAELARAAADRSWEEPVDTVARLLGQTLADSGWFERWGCILDGVWPRRENPDLPEEFASPEGVDVYFHQVRESGTGTDDYGYELIFTPDLSIEEQVRRLADHILADDPRKTAESWGR